LLQSCPTAKASELAALVVRETEAVFELLDPLELAPIPPELVKATIVNDWAYPLELSTERNAAPLRALLATAFHTSAVPGLVLVRRTKLHERLAPETVAVCPPLVDGPSDETKATRSSPACAVENPEIVATPEASTDATLSTPNAAAAPARAGENNAARDATSAAATTARPRLRPLRRPFVRTGGFDMHQPSEVAKVSVLSPPRAV
jgi:hypothetical protein